MSVLVCGEMLYDVFVEGPTEKGFALDARIGGSALNVAVGLARLGRPVSQLTGVSHDMFGQRLAAFLAGEGVDTSHLVRTPAPTTLATVTPGPDGSPAYAFYGEGAADRQVEVAHLPDPSGFDALVFGCFSLITRPTSCSFLELARRAKAARPAPLVVLDPNVRRTVEPDAAVWRRRIADFAAHADLVKTSREDLDETYAEAAETVVARWLAEGITAVIVTDGPRGATLHTRARTVTVPAAPVAVVDTVGAGDSFLAAVLAALSDAGVTTAPQIAALDEAACRAVLQFAVRAAGVTCTRRGADLPRRADLATPPDPVADAGGRR
ncbi:carbohydrate kinase [Acuticoccus sp. I52.16.1]|uniref:carbohydrate kinase family protein n=1 Tax=Acuticoccus sp. I52.16.1 TaxID=2928472 RepID=UPI001FD4D6AD|nr:carbohydrate kinase [Acuticoccus sp. I52.16.1]UOM35905.1 carbohydrate kinase [Acuticoccus sp. I52.16.1]